MNRPNAHRCQHQYDGFRTGWHVHGQAVAFVNPKSAKRGRDLLYFVQQMRVSVDTALSALVEVDQRSVSSPAALHMMIKRVVRQVGLRAYEPLEARPSPVQNAVPFAKPRQLIRCPPP